MEQIKNYLKKYWVYLVAFLIPFLIMITVYFSKGIYWNSEVSPLLGDGFHQYVIFDTTLQNILHESDSIFYTFTSGLGLNFYALSNYYLEFLITFCLFLQSKKYARCCLSLYFDKIWLDWIDSYH